MNFRGSLPNIQQAIVAAELAQVFWWSLYNITLPAETKKQVRYLYASQSLVAPFPIRPQTRYIGMNEQKKKLPTHGITSRSLMA